MNTPVRHVDFAVIGAGLAGAVIAHHLNQLGFSTLVLEKSRGVGGRIANRRLGNQSFSHGVQSFELEPAEQEKRFFGIFQRQHFESLGNGRFQILEPATQMIKHLIPDSMVCKDSKVISIIENPTDPAWTLILETGESIFCRHVFVTAPAPQALDLARPYLSSELQRKWSEVVYSKRIILFADASKPEMQFMDDPFSEEHFEKTDSQILQLEGSGRFMTVKKWRYEKVIHGVDLDFWSENGLHLCGDYFKSRPDRGISDSFRSAVKLLNQLDLPKTSL